MAAQPEFRVLHSSPADVTQWNASHRRSTVLPHSLPVSATPNFVKDQHHHHDALGQPLPLAVPHRLGGPTTQLFCDAAFVSLKAPCGPFHANGAQHRLRPGVRLELLALDGRRGGASESLAGFRKERVPLPAAVYNLKVPQPEVVTRSTATTSSGTTTPSHLKPHLEELPQLEADGVPPTAVPRFQGRSPGGKLESSRLRLPGSGGVWGSSSGENAAHASCPEYYGVPSRNATSTTRQSGQNRHHDDYAALVQTAVAPSLSPRLVVQELQAAATHALESLPVSLSLRVYDPHCRNATSPPNLNQHIIPPGDVLNARDKATRQRLALTASGCLSEACASPAQAGCESAASWCQDDAPNRRILTGLQHCEDPLSGHNLHLDPAWRSSDWCSAWSESASKPGDQAQREGGAPLPRSKGTPDGFKGRPLAVLPPATATATATATAAPTGNANAHHCQWPAGALSGLESPGVGAWLPALPCASGRQHHSRCEPRDQAAAEMKSKLELEVLSNGALPACWGSASGARGLPGAVRVLPCRLRPEVPALMAMAAGRAERAAGGLLFRAPRSVGAAASWRLPLSDPLQSPLWRGPGKAPIDFAVNSDRATAAFSEAAASRQNSAAFWTASSCQGAQQRKEEQQTTGKLPPQLPASPRAAAGHVSPATGRKRQQSAALLEAEPPAAKKAAVRAPTIPGAAGIQGVNGGRRPNLVAALEEAYRQALRRKGRSCSGNSQAAGSSCTPGLSPGSRAIRSPVTGLGVRTSAASSTRKPMPASGAKGVSSLDGRCDSAALGVCSPAVPSRGSSGLLEVDAAQEDLARDMTPCAALTTRGGPEVFTDESSMRDGLCQRATLLMEEQDRRTDEGSLVAGQGAHVSQTQAHLQLARRLMAQLKPWQQWQPQGQQQQHGDQAYIQLQQLRGNLLVHKEAEIGPLQRGSATAALDPAEVTGTSLASSQVSMSSGTPHMGPCFSMRMDNLTHLISHPARKDYEQAITSVQVGTKESANEGHEGEGTAPSTCLSLSLRCYHDECKH